MKFLLLAIISMISISSTMVFAHSGHDPEGALLQQGIQAYNQGKFDEAMSLFDLILEHNPGNADALNNKGTILNIQGNFVEAQTYFERTLEIRPRSVMALNNMGTSFIGQGDIEQGIQYFDKVLEMNPEHVNTLNNKADALIRLGEYEDAFTSLNKVMKIDSGNKEAIANLQFIEFKLEYLEIDGFMEIQVNDSQGNLVTHFRTRNFNVLDNSLAEDVINSFSVKKIIIRDGQEFEVLQKKISIREESDSTPGRTGFHFTYNPEVMIAYSTHYQFVLEEGDVVTFYSNIFRPIL